MAVRQESAFYTWQAPHGGVEVRLHYDAIEAINVDAMRGYGVTRRRGTEAGGVLIGRFENGGVTVLRHVLVPCEYSHGPSYILSDADLVRFRDTVAAWAPAAGREEYAVGYFRSHTRDGLQPDAGDAALLKTHFPDSKSITLLVKPYATRPPEAAIFLQRNGELALDDPSPEFLFERGPDSAPAPPPAALPAPARRTAAVPTPPPQPVAPLAARPLAPAPSPEAVVPREPAAEQPMFASYHPEPGSSWKTALAWIAFAFAAFALGGVAGHRYAILNAPAPSLQSEISAMTEAAYALDLAATHEGRNVTLRWNGSSAPMKQALRGVLTITEGRAPKEVNLGFAELRNGLLLYHNAGPAITFKLEVFLKENRALSETVSLRLAY